MGKVIKILLVIVVAAVIVLYFSVNSIIKNGVEAVGPQVLGTEVRLDKVSISMFSGNGQLKGIVIGNPKGFETESAFKLGEIKIAMDIGSLFSDRIVIDEILIDAPEVTYEKSMSGDNVRAILNNIEKFSGKSKSPDGADKKEEEAGEGKKVQINRLDITNGKVNMSVTALQGKKITMPLADIHLKDIGKEGKSSVSDAMKVIFASLNKNVAVAVAGSAKEIAKEAEGMVKSIAKDPEKALGKTTEDAVGKIKGIFGK